MSISEERFGRLEDKVDHIKEDVLEVKSEVKHMNETFQKQIELVNEHITGDQKIINVLEDLIPDLKDMAIDHATAKRIIAEKKIKREERLDKIKSIAAPLALISTVIGIIIGVVKLTTIF